MPRLVFAMREISPELEAEIYRSVLRAVLWDEKREEIFHLLQVNGIVGENAESMFRRARGERIAQIRGEAFRKMVRGIALFATGAGIFFFYAYGAGATTMRIALVFGGLLAWGAWWTLEGAFAAALAAKKTGSVISED